MYKLWIFNATKSRCVRAAVCHSDSEPTNCNCTFCKTAQCSGGKGEREEERESGCESERERMEREKKIQTTHNIIQRKILQRSADELHGHK